MELFRIQFYAVFPFFLEWTTSKFLALHSGNRLKISAKQWNYSRLWYLVDQAKQCNMDNNSILGHDVIHCKLWQWLRITYFKKWSNSLLQVNPIFKFKSSQEADKFKSKTSHNNAFKTLSSHFQVGSAESSRTNKSWLMTWLELLTWVKFSHPRNQCDIFSMQNTIQNIKYPHNSGLFYCWWFHNSDTNLEIAAWLLQSLFTYPLI